MSRVSSESFAFGSTALAGGTVASVATFVIPKGAKAVLTGASVATSRETAAGVSSITVTASGGSTDVFLHHSIAVSLTDGGFSIGNEGQPISGVIDASSAAITLTLSQVFDAADETFIRVTGEFIS